jgi:NOL1/NOP2/sun family putative RNA methylase
MSKIEFKKEFLEDYRILLGSKLEHFLECCKKPLRKSIRINTLKISVPEMKKRLKHWKPKQVPWCDTGFYVDAKEIGNTTEHFLGYIYVQEAASMIPPVALEVKSGNTVLDLCAAPGSKTTQMAAMMKNSGVVVANEVAKSRIPALRFNLQRCGVINTVITKMDARGLRIKNYFDKVLVDAPCSGVGAMRKKFEIANEWSKKVVRSLSASQKKMMLAGFDALKVGGDLVYSTCTLSPEENEEVVDFLLKNRDAEVMRIELDIKRDKAVLEWAGKKFDPSIKDCLRIYPQTNDSEGFFVAKVRRNG